MNPLHVLLLVLMLFNIFAIKSQKDQPLYPKKHNVLHRKEVNIELKNKRSRVPVIDSQNKRVNLRPQKPQKKTLISRACSAFQRCIKAPCHLVFNLLSVFKKSLNCINMAKNLVIITLFIKRIFTALIINPLSVLKKSLNCIKMAKNLFFKSIKWTSTSFIKWVIIGVIINPLLIGGNFKNGLFAMGRLYCPEHIRKFMKKYIKKDWRIIAFLALLLTQILSFFLLWIYGYFWGSYSYSWYTSLLNVVVMIVVDSIAYLTKKVLVCTRLTSEENANLIQTMLLAFGYGSTIRCLDSGALKLDKEIFLRWYDFPRNFDKKALKLLEDENVAMTVFTKCAKKYELWKEGCYSSNPHIKTYCEALHPCSIEKFLKRVLANDSNWKELKRCKANFTRQMRTNAWHTFQDTEKCHMEVNKWLRFRAKSCANCPILGLKGTQRSQPSKFSLDYSQGILLIASFLSLVRIFV